MSNRVFYYFYAPTWDYPPEGPIKLGNVLMSVKTPESPLFTAPLPSAEEVFSMDKNGVEYSAEKLREGRFSILTKFLSFLGVGVDTSVSWEKNNEDVYSFKRVETVQFVPKDEYVQKCVEAAPVRNYLEKSRYRKPVYIVTGIKTVHGAKAKTVVTRGYGGKLGVEVDGTVWSGGAVPVGGGPEVEGRTRNKHGTSWESSGDFVLAFRVRKVRVERKTGQVSKNEDHLKGTMLGDEAKKKAEDVPHLSVLAEEDTDPEAEGYRKDELMEGDDVVACAFPTVEDDEDDEDDE